MAHYIPSMMALETKTRELFDALPREFTKKQYEEMRNKLASSGHYHYITLDAISLKTAREYGIIKVVREEKTIYKKEVLVAVNPATNETYTFEELDDIWCKKLAREFGISYTGHAPHKYQYGITTDYTEKEFEGFRNIFMVNWKKFEEICQGR